MSKVYIVIFALDDIVGVFKTKKLAEKFIKNSEDYPSEYTKVEEWIVVDLESEDK